MSATERIQQLPKSRRHLWFSPKIIFLLGASLLWTPVLGQEIPDFRNHPDQALDAAVMLKAQGKIDDAEQLLLMVLAASKGQDSEIEVRGLFTLGDLRLMQRRVPEALEFFARVREIARGRPELEYWAAFALTDSASAYLYNQQYGKAESALLQAGVLWRRQTVPAARFYSAFLEYLRGRVMLSTSRPAQASRAFQQALQVRIEHEGDRQVIQALAHSALANAYAENDEFSQAMNELQHVSLTAENAIPAALLAMAQESMAETYLQLGMPRPALPLFERALAFFESSAAEDEAKAATLFSRALFETGQYQESLKRAQQALNLAARKNDLQLYAGALNNLAGNATVLSANEVASSALQQALPALSGPELEPLRLITLQNLGVLSLTLGHNNEALDYFGQALRIAVKQKDPATEAQIRSSIGLVKSELQQSQAAQIEFRRAAMLANQLKANPRARGVTLNNIAWNYARSGHDEQAVSVFYKAAENLREAGDIHTEIRARTNLGFVQYRLRHYSAAIACLQHAQTLQEQLRNLIHDPDARMGLLSGLDDVSRLMAAVLADADTQAPALQFPVAVLKDSGSSFAGAALNYAERGRARSLLDVLGDATDRLSAQRLPPELAKRERLLLAEEGAALREPAKTRDGGHTPESIRSYTETANEFGQFVAILRNSPDPAVRSYAELRYPEPARSEAIQRALSSNEVLLEYLVMPNATLVFVVQSTGPVQIKHLPITSTELTQNIMAVRSAIITGSSDLPTPTLSDLYRRLLAPVLAEVPSSASLLVVPDHQLFRLPLEMLGHETPQGWKYVGEERNISYFPSATIFTIARKQLQTLRERPDLQLLAVGDPDYGSTTEPCPEAVGPTARRAAKRDGIVPLPCSRPEVLGIAELFGMREDSPGVLLGAQANKARLQQLSSEGELARYAIVHISAHGQLAQEPVLLLSNRGKADDGRLTMDEVFQLKLNSDMVVLSACDTGLGEQVTGEGIVGMPRALLHAGSRAVVVSLWEVDDSSSAVLMKEFYSHLRQGLGRAEALRDARKTLIRSGKYAHPFYWAPFVVIGEP